MYKRLAFAGLAMAILHSSAPAQDAALNCAPPTDHAVIRSNMINLNLLQVQANSSYLVVGDSIVEAAMLEPICGLTPINAGIGGGTAQTLSNYSSGWSGYKFKAVVVALGVNNATRSNDIRAFRAAYEGIFNKLASTGAEFLVADVMPVEKGKKLADEYFDNDVILKLNTEIASLAERHGATLINLHNAFTRPGSNSMRSELNVDGVHINAAGYKIWRRAIAEAVSGRLKCDPTVSAH